MEQSHAAGERDEGLLRDPAGQGAVAARSAPATSDIDRLLARERTLIRLVPVAEPGVGLYRAGNEAVVAGNRSLLAAVATFRQAGSDLILEHSRCLGTSAGPRALATQSGSLRDVAGKAPASLRRVLPDLRPGR